MGIEPTTSESLVQDLTTTPPSHPVVAVVADIVDG